jgi:hypothetical protein
VTGRCTDAAILQERNSLKVAFRKKAAAIWNKGSLSSLLLAHEELIALRMLRSATKDSITKLYNPHKEKY